MANCRSANANPCHPALLSSAGLFDATFLHIYTRDRHGENVPDALRVKDMQQAELVDGSFQMFRTQLAQEIPVS